MKHLTAIDGLRAVAVLAVVAYHAGLPVPAGFVGVDVFFVISGYLITRLLHDELAGTGRIDFVAFYARRARRILPALAVVILATLGLASVLMGDASDVARSAAAASGFVANLWFLAHSGYWAPQADTQPLLHLWSLSVEEQFYLVWPVVLLFARRKPVAALAVLAVASLALAEWWMYQNPDAAFYQMPARAWELAVGGLVALHPLRIPKAVTWGGLALVLEACFVPFGHFPGLGALPAVLGSALLIAGVQAGQRVPVLETRPVVYVGLISYSLYLWHWPLLALDRAMRVDPSPLSMRMKLVVMAFLLAVLSYRWVEGPFRRARASHRKSVAVGVACLAVLCCGAMTYATATTPPLTPATIAGRDLPANHKACQLSPESPITPDPRCQSRPGTPDVVMWGDSMAQSWQPFAYGLGHVAVSYSRIGCPSLVGYTNTTRRDRLNALCTVYTQEILRRAHNARTVILANAWRDYFQPDRAVESERELDATLKALAGRNVVILGPTPMLPAPAPKCLQLGSPCTVKRARFLSDTALARTALERQARRHGATYLDPTDFFCTPDCSVSRDGYALYWDFRHVSSTAATKFLAWYQGGSGHTMVSGNAGCDGTSRRACR